MKIWAILNKDNYVTNYFLGDYNNLISQIDEKNIVEMTNKNSPAFIGAFYNGKSFIERKQNA
jgi:hypothetical protein